MPTPTPRVSVRTRKVALVTLAVFTFSFVIAGLIVTYQRRQPPVETINYSQLYSFAETGAAIALQVEGELLTVTKSDGSRQEATVTGEAAQHEIVQLFRKQNVPVEFRPLQPGFLVSSLNWVLPVLTLAFIGFAGWRIYASKIGRASLDRKSV